MHVDQPSDKATRSRQAVPNRFEWGFFVRAPSFHVASPRLGALHPTHAGRVSHGRAPLAAAPGTSGIFWASSGHPWQGVSRPRGAVYPIASRPRSPRSVHPVITAPGLARWRAGGVKSPRPTPLRNASWYQRSPSGGTSAAMLRDQQGRLFSLKALNGPSFRAHRLASRPSSKRAALLSLWNRRMSSSRNARNAGSGMRLSALMNER
jgi:hypothetical protein